MYSYLKAIHIIFIVTWFAGMFYMPRLFIYATEAGEKNETERNVLRNQFAIMMKRLWYGITWPSAILTLIFGPLLMFNSAYADALFKAEGRWLLIKLVFVLLLYVYHFSLHKIFLQQQKGIYKYSSQQLRMWNEVATIFLVAIVTLAVVKQTESFLWSLAGLIGFIIVLMSAIKIYKRMREKNIKDK
ncbi:MAG TPA: CopD family protein [Chitinophagaceae bacterium]|nr:CopD family protein [Chitinophagaceae bacterium]